LADNRKCQIILTEIYLQSVLGENISLTIIDLGLDADVRSLKKAAALTVGDTENAKLGKVKCTSSAWF
jgi:hypothetical protein